MSRAALWVAAAIGMSPTATAFAERPDHRLDGSVVAGEEVFPTLAAYYASPAFRESGARCGSVDAPVVDTLAPALAPADCTFQRTTISPRYGDDRVFVIQVVFHVIRKTDGTGDLSPDLIRSQIDVLNEDFGALAGTPGAPGIDTRVQFVLARFDPMGRPTTGIEVITSDSYFADPGGGVSPMKVALSWDPKRYLNIYTNDAHGYLGYATFPQDTAGRVEDGVVLLWSAVGRNAPGGPPYDLGRTATHEVGHYLGLFHTFQGGCGQTTLPYTTGDLIGDTNRERQASYGCTPAESACQGGGMNPIENYMDYSDDACMNRFSAEQANRLRCAIVNYRGGNTAPAASFTHEASGMAVTFTNTSTDGESQLAELKSRWTFGDGRTSTEESPTHTYAAEGTYEVTLELVDPGSGTAAITESVVVVIGSKRAADSPDGDGELGGCCQAPGGGLTALLCALPAGIVLRRRRRRRA